MKSSFHIVYCGSNVEQENGSDKYLNNDRVPVFCHRANRTPISNRQFRWGDVKT